MKLELVRRGLNHKNQIETIYKTDVKINPAISINYVKDVVREALLETVFFRVTQEKDDGTVIIVNEAYEPKDYYLHILCDLNDGTYSVAVVENEGRTAFTHIAPTIIITKDGGYIPDEEDEEQ